MCLTHSAEIDKLAAALAKAQGAIDDAVKDAKNPAFKQAGLDHTKYADLSSVRDAIRMPLSANGLSYVQFPEADGNKVSCETMLMHETGQWIRGKLTMVATQSTPQGIGSAITYCRRYSLMAVTGIAPADDDDGNAASAKPPQNNDDRRDYRDETPFDEPAPPKAIEPAVSTKAVNMGRALKDCRTIADLKAIKRTVEWKEFIVSVNSADMKYVETIGEARWNEIEAASTDNILAAG